MWRQLLLFIMDENKMSRIKKEERETPDGFYLGLSWCRGKFTCASVKLRSLKHYGCRAPAAAPESGERLFNGNV